MDRYIQQLIEDLALAEANPIPETDFGATYEEFEKAMFEIEQAPKVLPEKLLNVGFEQLPPVEKLNKTYWYPLSPVKLCENFK